MAFNKKIVDKFQEWELGIQVELGDDSIYPMIGIDTLSFKMPSSNVLELHDVLFVLGLKKNLLFYLTITNLQRKVDFDDQY